MEMAVKATATSVVVAVEDQASFPLAGLHVILPLVQAAVLAASRLMPTTLVVAAQLAAAVGLEDACPESGGCLALASA